MKRFIRFLKEVQEPLLPYLFMMLFCLFGELMIMVLTILSLI